MLGERGELSLYRQVNATALAHKQHELLLKDNNRYSNNWKRSRVHLELRSAGGAVKQERSEISTDGRAKTVNCDAQ